MSTKPDDASSIPSACPNCGVYLDITLINGDGSEPDYSEMGALVRSVKRDTKPDEAAASVEAVSAVEPSDAYAVIDEWERVEGEAMRDGHRFTLKRLIEAYANQRVQQAVAELKAEWLKQDTKTLNVCAEALEEQNERISSHVREERLRCARLVCDGCCDGVGLHRPYPDAFFAWYHNGTPDKGPFRCVAAAKGILSESDIHPEQKR